MDAAQESTWEYSIEQHGIEVRYSAPAESRSVNWLAIVGWCGGVDSTVVITRWLHGEPMPPVSYSVAFGDRICSIKGGDETRKQHLILPLDDLLPHVLFSCSIPDHGAIYRLFDVLMQIPVFKSGLHRPGDSYTGDATLVGIAYEYDLALCTTAEGNYAVFNASLLEDAYIAGVLATADLPTPGIRVFVEPDSGGIDAPQRPGDAGYDLQAAAASKIYPGDWKAVRTGVHIEIPDGYVGLIRDRSSVAGQGLSVRGGVIDAGFRGEIKVMLYNASGVPYDIVRGDRIAQMLILPVLVQPLVAVAALDELSPSERGEAGFGCTGAQSGTRRLSTHGSLRQVR